MLGILGNFKIIAILITIIGIMGTVGYFSYNSLKAQNELLKQNVVTLKQVVKQQKNTIDTMNKNFNIIQKEQKKLFSKFNSIENSTSKLRELFNDHDFRNLVQEKPGLIENRINKGTDNVLDEFREITKPSNFYDDKKN